MLIISELLYEFHRIIYKVLLNYKSLDLAQRELVFSIYNYTCIFRLQYLYPIILPPFTFFKIILM
jgi:hypothetical protein